MLERLVLSLVLTVAILLAPASVVSAQTPEGAGLEEMLYYSVEEGAFEVVEVRSPEGYPRPLRMIPDEEVEVLVTFKNISGQTLYDVEAWASRSLIFTPAGEWSDDRAVFFEELLAGQSFSVYVKLYFEEEGSYNPTVYADGKTCNLGVNPPDCYFYGASSVTIPTEVNAVPAWAYDLANGYYRSVQVLASVPDGTELHVRGRLATNVFDYQVEPFVSGEATFARYPLGNYTIWMVGEGLAEDYNPVPRQDDWAAFLLEFVEVSFVTPTQTPRLATPTNTSTPTNTVEPTDTPTNIPVSPTVTSTPTNTPMSTPTETPTPMSMSTPTPTNTPIVTETPMPTSTPVWTEWVTYRVALPMVCR